MRAYIGRSSLSWLAAAIFSLPAGPTPLEAFRTAVLSEQATLPIVSPWKRPTSPGAPLGRLLVEQGLLTGDDLERALAEQQVTGERLGETIVKLGMVSGPELANALAAQYGIELTTEKGFGTGLRSEIQRRHESDRKRSRASCPRSRHGRDTAARRRAGDGRAGAAPEPDAGDAPLLAQLEEQWAKLAAAEEALAERERELEELTRSHDRERSELAERERELTELAESRERELAELVDSRERAVAEGRERELAELREAASSSAQSWPSASASSGPSWRAGSATSQSGLSVNNKLTNADF